METTLTITDETRTDSRTWRPVTRYLFRFAVIYILMFSLSHFFVAPIGEDIGDFWEKPWGSFVPWVGKVVFGIEEMTARPLGSGDTTYNYVQIFIMVVLAGAGSLIWSLIDRRKTVSRIFTYASTVYLRYYLGLVMLSYGMAKVIKTQFPFPFLNQLIKPYGESSPMNLLWTFMGYSASYTIFAGLGEIIGGVLLLFRRTRTLGALIVFGIMTNVVMLNFSYDVPVKIFSTHLLIFALLLLIPDAKRLARVFFLNQTAFPADLSSPIPRGRYNYIGIAAKVLVIGFAITTTTMKGFEYQEMIGSMKSAPLRGIYDVEAFIANGQDLDPVLTDTLRWRRMIVDYENAAFIYTMNEQRQYVRFETDTLAKAITMYTTTDTLNKANLLYAFPDSNRLSVKGIWQGDTLDITFSRREEADFLLANRGFHWINEVPFNR